MSVSAALYSLSSIPIFAARPFLAAFLTALVARFGTHLPWIGDHAIVVALHAGPVWFQSTACLVALALLAGLEAFAAKSPEAREILEDVEGWLKSIVAGLVAFALIDTDTARTIGSIQHAGFTLSSAWGVLVGGGTFVMAELRRGVVALVHDADDGDDVGLVSLLAWVENSWTVLGILLLLVFPLLALALSALTTLGIWWMRRRALEREQRSRVPCAQCATPILSHASACHACGRELDLPRGVGAFGQPKDAPDPDRARHAFQLVSRKRCPRCATRLTKRAVRQPCPACAKVTFGSEQEFESYLAVIRARLPRTLLVSFGLGAIPLLGVIPGVIYYRLNLVAGLRGYIPPLRGCTTKWVVRLFGFGIIALQPIPILGAFVLPLQCWITYTIYRRSLAGRARGELAASADAPARAPTSPRGLV
jgi:hypothetical protein